MTATGTADIEHRSRLYTEENRRGRFLIDMRIDCALNLQSLTAVDAPPAAPPITAVSIYYRFYKGVVHMTRDMFEPVYQEIFPFWDAISETDKEEITLTVDREGVTEDIPILKVQIFTTAMNAPALFWSVREVFGYI